jgi:hypothetical protein
MGKDVLVVAVAGGSTVKTSWLAGPALSVIVLLTAGVNDPSLAVRV